MFYRGTIVYLRYFEPTELIHRNTYNVTKRQMQMGRLKWKNAFEHGQLYHPGIGSPFLHFDVNIFLFLLQVIPRLYKYVLLKR